MKKKLDLEKIIKEVEKVEKYIEQDGYFLTTKGIVHIVVNMIEEQLE